jgi:hypothetical protein
VSVCAFTDLTIDNCPTDFDVARYNGSLSRSNQGLAGSLYGSVLNAEVQARVTTAISEGDIGAIQSEFLSLSFLTPYILIIALFWFLFLATICCCLFERRCPPCKSWRRNYVKDPYTNC